MYQESAVQLCLHFYLLVDSDEKVELERWFAMRVDGALYREVVTRKEGLQRIEPGTNILGLHFVLDHVTSCQVCQKTVANFSVVQLCESDVVPALTFSQALVER